METQREQANWLGNGFDSVRNLAQSTACGAAVAAALGVSALALDEPGGIKLKEPAEPQPALIDSHVSVVSWNLYRKVSPHVGSIRKMAKDNKVDAFMFQEVSASGFQKLTEKFPEWWIGWDKADPEPGDIHEPLGNVIMTKQEPKDSLRQDIAGSSFNNTLKGVTVGAKRDLLNLDSSATMAKVGVEENRTIATATIKVLDKGETKDMRIGTTHISGNPSSHTRQFGQVTKFLRKDTKENRPTIFCADFNPLQGGEVASEFSRIRYITLQAQRNQPTHENGKTLDYCVYFDAHTLATSGLGKTTVLTKYRSSDHYPISSTWNIRAAEQKATSAVDKQEKTPELLAGGCQQKLKILHSLAENRQQACQPVRFINNR